MEECKYEIKKNEMKNLIDYDFVSSSSHESDREPDQESDNESDNSESNEFEN